MKNKKGEIHLINTLLISFVGVVVIILLSVFIISTLKSTTLVCGNDPDGIPTKLTSSNTCIACPSSAWIFNTTGTACCNATGGTGNCLGANTTASSRYNGYAYNATLQVESAQLLAPQMMSIVIVVIIIVGLLALLATVGYTVYQKIK